MVPYLSNKQQNMCENEILEEELLDVLKKIDSNKIPGNGRIIKELYKSFWENIKKPFLKANDQAKITKTLITTQRKVILKLVEIMTEIKDI